MPVTSWCLRLVAWMVFLGVVSISWTARAEVPLLNTFGGPSGFGTQCLCPNDDGSSAPIDLRPAFPSGLRFFDRTHTTAYVNTNGNITFSGPLPTYTPRAFPVANQPMIAPYWADVDTRGERGGDCQYDAPSGGGCGSVRTCQNRPENEVWWTLEPGRMVVTWHRVGYFECHDNLRMSFQLILTAASDCGNPGDFDVEFRYNQCEWTTGDASGGTGGFGGTAAQAGFDAGNSRDYVEIRGSRTREIHRILCTGSNVGMPGIWRFQIRSGTVMCPDAGRPCSTGQMGVCAEGRTQCVGSGTMCVALNPPSPERCDGLDNDCNGMVDDGATCPAGERCVRGMCIGQCVEGACFEGYTCRDGECIETSCIGVSCPAGQRCRGGRCVGACEGITCPVGQVCRAGRCMDPCEGLMCASMLVCEDGVCLPRCGRCRPCPSGRTCQESTGRCVESSCAAVTCAPGTVCSGGRCVDPCMNARCPDGERCEMGRCVPSASMSPTDGGTGPADDAGTGGEDGGGGGNVEEDAGDGTDGGLGGEGGFRRGSGGTSPGCACRTVGWSGRGRGDAVALAALMLMFAARRRRRAYGH